METHKVNISFVVTVGRDVVTKDMDIDWIECDSAETIAKDIKEAILNIE